MNGKDLARLADSWGVQELPNDKALEELILARFIQLPEKAGELAGVLTEDTFYQRSNQALLKAIQSILQEGSTPTIPAILIQLQKTGMSRAIATSEYDSAVEVLDCLNFYPIHPETNWVEVLQHLNGLAVRRKAIQLLDRKRVALYENADPIQTLLEIDTEIQVFIESQETDDGLGHWENIVDRSMEKINAAIENPNMSAIKSGFVDIDEATNGFMPGDLHLIGGCTGVGKTHLGLAMANSFAEKGHSVFYFSLEMPAYQVWSRIAASRMGVNSNKFRDPSKLTDEDIAKLIAGEAECRALPIYVHTDFATFDTAIAKANQQFQQHGQAPTSILIFDYIQGACSESDTARKGSSTFEINALARKLKNLSVNQGICTLALAQLNFDVIGQRNDKRPSLSDFSESKLMIQACDLAWVLHSQSYWVEKNEKRQLRPGEFGYNELNIYFDKNRFDQSTHTTVILEKEYSRIRNAAKSIGGGVYDA